MGRNMRSPHSFRVGKKCEAGALIRVGQKHAPPHLFRVWKKHEETLLIQI